MITDQGIKSILLADDDVDDRLLFQEALTELHKETNLIIARDGLEMMQMLETKAVKNPDVIFLDLNMPRKNGFD